MREQRLRRLVREEIQRLNEGGWHPDEQFGGDGSPFAGHLSKMIVNYWKGKYKISFDMYGSSRGQKPFIVPNAEEVAKNIQFANNQKSQDLFYDKMSELERKVKEKFRKDTLKTRKEIEKLILNEFEKMKSELL